MNQTYPHLFSPIRVGTQIYRNRIEISPMGGVEFLPDGVTLDRERTFTDIDRRAKSGAAVFLIGETAVSEPGGRSAHGEHASYGFRDLSEEHLAPFKETAERVHSCGARVLIELCHVGAAKVDTLQPAYGPDDTVNEAGVSVHAMSAEDIAQTCRDFADAALFMQKAGMDGVVIHAGHGWLFTQFLSTLTNHRTDEYGGSLENRSRISVEAAKAIREACGPDFVIEARISGRQNMSGENGYTDEDIVAYCKYIEPYVDIIHVSAGMYRDPMRTWQESTLYMPHGCNVDIAAKIRENVNIPVSVVGGINSPEMAEELIAQGKVDMVALGRQMRADERWAVKAQSGRGDEIRRCLRCMRCFPGPFEEAMAELGGVFPEGCSINPTSKHPQLLTVEEAKEKKKVLIVGGGVAGMQAAVTARDRGHEVLLIERKEATGGILNYAKDDPDKQDLPRFAQTLLDMAVNRGVQIRVKTSFSSSLLREECPDRVIIAAGSSPMDVPVPVSGEIPIVKAMDTYRADAQTGRRVVILGGGQVGCETAIHLARQGKDVVLVEMRDVLAPDAYRLHKHQLWDLIAQLADARLNTKCTAITPEGVEVEKSDGTHEVIPADTIVAAIGMRANDTSEIEAACESAGVPFRKIGDCVRARRIFDAVDEGFMAALEI